MKNTIITMLVIGGAIFLVQKRGGIMGLVDSEGRFNSVSDGWGTVGEWGSDGGEFVGHLSDALTAVIESMPQSETAKETFRTALVGASESIQSVIPSFNSALAGAFGDSESQLLEQIAKGEGTSDAHARLNGYASGNDITLGYGAYVDDKIKPISSMTLSELDKLQTQMLKNPRNKWNSSAAGKYQIVRTTRRSLDRQLGFSPSTIYSASVQRQMAVKLLNGRGYQDYKNGLISAEEFQYNLSREWASIENPYTGRAIQHTGTTTADIMPIIKRLGVA